WNMIAAARHVSAVFRPCLLRLLLLAGINASSNHAVAQSLEKIFSDDFFAQIDKGREAYQTGAFKNAASEYLAAAADNPESFKAKKWAGISLDLVGSLKEAES